MYRFLILTIVILSTLPLTAQPRISFEETRIPVSDVTPKGSISWLSVSIGREGWMNRIIPWAGTASDEDGDGVIVLEPEHPLALRSVWAVVDNSTGKYTIGTPEGFESGPLSPDGLVGRARGLRTTLDLLEIERNEIELLVVRPHVGAWRLTAMEGSPQDADGSNDRVLTMRFADLEPLGVPGSAVPGALKPGDIVIAIDPEDLSHFAAVAGR